jgi:RimJ/RimL family protein N-acetyltransferase
MCQSALFRSETLLSGKYTEGKIRDFEVTMEDSARLAACYNSFDDSDSWPGGFTHGNPYTAERIFEFKQKSEDIRTIVAYAEDQIIGHCNVCGHYLDDEAVYVGLFGVDPAFQGQGYGKAMLIESAETAARLGKRRIDLHTWGGNLKAMPLYKRVGYNWVPNTRVLMESHIPGIINAPMFEEFFQRHYWYDAYKREILQEMDEIVEDGFGIFKYHFEDDEDVLDVVVDREAKGISGFTMTLDGKTVSAHLKPSSHIGFIGLGEIPIELKIQNNQEISLTYSVQVNTSENFVVKLEGSLSGEIEPGDQTILNAACAISSTAKALDREIIPDDKVQTQGEWIPTLGGKSIKLYCGLIPNEAVTLFADQSSLCLTPGESKEIALGVRNNINRDIKGEIDISPLTDRISPSGSYSISLSSNEETEIYFNFKTSVEEESSLVPLQLSVFIQEGSSKALVNQRVLNVCVIGAFGAYAYQALDDEYVLESETLRFILRKTPPMSMRKCEYKPTNDSISGEFNLPQLGYPFQQGSEWERKKFKVTMRNLEKYAEIELIGDSEERNGVRFTILHRLYPGREYLEVITKVQNFGLEIQTNLGLRMGGWFDIRNNEFHVPIKGDIYRLDSPEWNGIRQTPTKPKFYHESWCSSHRMDSNMEIGYIWSPENIEEVRVTRSFRVPRVEYKLPDLEPGQSTEKSMLHMHVTQGDWTKTRNLWARLHGKSIDETEPIHIRSDLEVEIVSANSSLSKEVCPPILIDRAKKEQDFELRVRVIHEDPLSGKVSVKLPQGVFAGEKQKLEFEMSNLNIDNPFITPLKLSVNDVQNWFTRDGEISLQFTGRIVRFPLSAIIYNSTVKPITNEETLEGRTLHTLTIGGYSIAASPEYIGSLVRYGPTDKESLFFDTFPKSEPFMWWNQFFSGLNPAMAGWDIWDWESAFQKEEWTLKESKEGPWIGYELATLAQHSPGLRGIELRVQYLMLQNTPLVYINLEVSNKSKRRKKMRLFLRGVPRPDGAIQNRIHTVFNEQQICYEPREVETDLPSSPKHGWVAFENPKTGQMVGIISNERTRESVAGFNMGDNADMLFLFGNRTLKPGEASSISSFLVIPISPNDMTLLNRLSTSLVKI